MPVKELALDVLELDAKLPFDCVKYAESSNNNSSDGVLLEVVKWRMEVELELVVKCLTVFFTTTFSNLTDFDPVERSPSCVVVVKVS